jgi:hypothetical protein
LDLLPICKFSFNKIRPGVNGRSMAFTQIVENGNFMPFIEQKLGANASDIARTANDKDFHWREECIVIGVKSKATRQFDAVCHARFSRRVSLIRTRSASGSILRDGFAFLLFQGNDHLANAIVFAARGENFQAFFVGTPLQNVDVDVADTPFSNLRPGALVKIDGVGSDQRISVIVDDVFFVCLRKAKAGPKRIPRPV